MRLAWKAATGLVALLIGMALGLGAKTDDTPKTINDIRVPTRIDVGR